MQRNGLIWLLLLVFVTACGPGNFLSPAQPTLAPQALTISAAKLLPTLTPTSTLTPSPTFTMTPASTLIPTNTSEPPFVPTVPTLISKDSPYPQACGFNWARQERPELSEQIRGALEEKGFAEVTVNASDYGENCVAYETGVVQYFTAMNTDFYITFPVESTAKDMLSTHVFDLMMVLKEDWSEVTSESIARGKVELTFVSDAGEVSVHGEYGFLMNLTIKHPDGKNLLDNCTSLDTGPKALRLTCRAN
jgi:hypothetical protein